MNRYQLSFSARCPVNGRAVRYDVTVETPSGRTIMVEDLQAACAVEETLHEPLADALFVRFGGRQVITALHHGVRITTVRE